MPSKDKKRELYLAGSMAELQKKSEVKPQTTNARILVKSADTMFREAEKVDLQGDEEKAFIMYMRYFNIVKQVKTNADYKKNKQYYDSLLGQKNQVRAIEQAEQLAASLKERYDFKEAEAVAQKFAALEASGQRKEKEAEMESDKAADNKDSSVDEDGSRNQPSTSASSQDAVPTHHTPMATGGSGPEDPDACPVCLETFRQPKFLPCHHTFCSHCIQDIVDRHRGGSFPCPLCRAQTSLPPGGVASLQTNFNLPCQPAQQSPAAQELCPVHPEEQLRFYCLTCDQTICRTCRFIGHHQHRTFDLTPVARNKRKALRKETSLMPDSRFNVY